MGVPRFLGLSVLALSLLVSTGFAAQPSPTSTASRGILPKSFAGWQITDSAQVSSDPASADPVNADLLKEYGFTDASSAIYSRDDGRKLTLKAARFQDATGAYGAFTFYRTPEMQEEKIGDWGSSLNDRVLFFRGNILVEAKFQRFSAMSAPQLRELAAELPKPAGSEANLPMLPNYLPKHSYVKNSGKFVLGPIGLDKAGAPLSAQYIDFGKSAEMIIGDYNVGGALGKLMVIRYPTEQIAAGQLKQIESAEQTSRLASQTIARRSGPLVIVSTGHIPESDARALLSSVNYDADITWNENTYFTRRDNAANLIVGVILLAAIICGLSLVAGLVFGGFRVAVKRLMPGKIFDRPEQLEIIALNIDDRVPGSGDSSVSSSIKAG
jgi:hypothetical protein